MTDKEIDSYKRRLSREANPEKHKAYLAAWQKANPEKCREASRRYYKRNKAKKNAGVMAWHKANPDRVKAIRRAYYLRRKARLAASHA